MTETLAGGRYTIVRRIAQGGMGDVLLAEFPGDTALGVSPGLVVIKRVLTDHPNHDHQAAMLREEGRVALRLLHDNLVETFFVDDDDGDPLLVMEFLSGRAASHVLGKAKKRKELVPVEVALSLLRAAACGLHFAHTLTDRGRPLGLIHRDVSPANLFVTFDGRVKVIDFGVAKADDSEIRTSTGILKGKLGYMSPEHALGEKLTPAADMWSLGVLFWETLCAERLFSHAAPSATLAAISDRPIPLPSVHRPDLPPHIIELTMRLLERRLDKRIGGGAALVAAIDALPEATGLARVDLGSWLSGRFPDEAAQGQLEASRCARMRRRTPVPIGLVEGTASPAPVDDDAPTVVIASAASLIPKDMLEGEDELATLRLSLDELSGPGAEALTKKLRGGTGGGSLLADVDSQSGPSPPSPAGDDVDVDVDEGEDVDLRTAQLPDAQAAEAPRAPLVSTSARTRSPSGLSTTLRALDRGSSWVAVAFLTFGALAVAMGVAFSFLAPHPSVRALVAYDAAGGADEIVVALRDAPPEGGRTIDVADPHIKIGGALKRLDPASFDEQLEASGVKARATLPQTGRGILAVLLPVLIAGLGVLALAGALPALAVGAGRLRVLSQVLLVAVCALALAGVVKRGALSWPGLDTIETPAQLQPRAP